MAERRAGGSYLSYLSYRSYLSYLSYRSYLSYPFCLGGCAGEAQSSSSGGAPGRLYSTEAK